MEKIFSHVLTQKQVKMSTELEMLSWGNKRIVCIIQRKEAKTLWWVDVFKRNDYA